MPYIPPHLRAKSYYADAAATPKIASTLAEAEEMSKAVTNAPKSAFADMLNTPAPHRKKRPSQAKPKAQQQAVKKRPNATTIEALKESQALANVTAVRQKIASASSLPVASGSFSGMISPLTPAPVKPKKATMIAHQPVKQENTVTLNDPAFDAAMDDILRAIFEENMKSVKRLASAQADNFTRRPNGSYKNERIESRFQGFKLQKLEECAGKAGDALEKILRARFEIAMQGVKRTAAAAPLDFITRRTNGAYANERLESRFQGYLMASVSDFGLSVLRKIADNRVVALKAIR